MLQWRNMTCKHVNNGDIKLTFKSIRETTMEVNEYNSEYTRLVLHIYEGFTTIVPRKQSKGDYKLQHYFHRSVIVIWPETKCTNLSSGVSSLTTGVAFSFQSFMMILSLANNREYQSTHINYNPLNISAKSQQTIVHTWNFYVRIWTGKQQSQTKGLFRKKLTSSWNRNAVK